MSALRRVRPLLRRVLFHGAGGVEWLCGLLLGWRGLRQYLGRRMTLQGLSRLEAAHVRLVDDLLLRPLLRAYYRRQAAEIRWPTQGADTQPSQVVFVLNIFHLFKQPVSSHLKLIGDIISLYADAGYKVSMLLLNHPYTSQPRNANLAVQDMFHSSRQLIEDRVRADLLSMNGRSFDDCSIRVLLNAEQTWPLTKAVDAVASALADFDLGPADHLFAAAGVVGSDLGNEVLAQAPGPKKHCLVFSAEFIVPKAMIRPFDTIIQPLGERNATVDHQGTIREACYSVSPLHWALDRQGELHPAEEQLLEALRAHGPDVLYVAVKQDVVGVLTESFAQALKGGCPPSGRAAVVLIGTNGKQPSALTRGGHWQPADVFTLDYSPHLSQLFHALQAIAPAVLCMPPCSGGGFGMQLSTFAGMPLVAYRGSDGEIYYPPACFADSREAYSARLYQLSTDAAFRQSEAEAQLQHFDGINARWQQFYLDLVGRA